MGVRGLQTFLQKKVKDGIVPIKIADEVDKYKKFHNGKKPLIVIDLLTLQSSFHQSNEELILGGRYHIYAEEFRSTMRRLKSLGVKIVFFIDGTSSEEKVPIRLERRMNGYNKGIQILSEINSLGFPTKDSLSNINPRLPMPFLTYIASLAREFGTVRVSVLNDCDVEAAEYATRNEALAVLTNDTDYLIFEGSWHFWSSTDLDIKTLTTKEFNRDALRVHLNLRSDQMAILATLAGNDFVPSGSFQDFHAIAQSIRSHNLSVNDYEAIPSILPRLKVYDIKASLKSYSYRALKRKYPSNLLKVVSQTDGIMNYSMLADKTVIIPMDYFDLSKTDMQPFFDLIRPLLRRVMGILLQHEGRPGIRTFFCKLKANSGYEKILLEPQYPRSRAKGEPSLSRLLAHKEGLDTKLDETRVKLACWAISPMLKLDTFSQLPSKQVACVTTLFYLVKKWQISIDEADCLLLACNMRATELNYVKPIKERAARIAFLFTNTLVYIQNCFHAVGLKKFCSIVPFDGLVFHYFNKTWYFKDQKFKDEKLEPFVALRIYDTES